MIIDQQQSKQFILIKSQKQKLYYYRVFSQGQIRILSYKMNFDDLDDVLEDTDYVPSFAPKEKKKPLSNKAKSIADNQSKQFSNDSLSFSPLQAQVTQPVRKGGMFALHKQSAKQQVISFEQLFDKKDQTESKFDKDLGKNKSYGSFNPSNIIQDDNRSNFSAQRTAMRPSLREKDKDQTESITIQRRNMMPPLSRKNNQKKQQTDFHDASSVDTKSVINKKPIINNDLNPLQALNNQQSIQAKKMLEQHIEFQKQSMKKLLQNQRQSHKKQIQKLKQIHEEQLKKKVQLKDYEIKKIKEFYELQLALKTEKNTETNELNTASIKIQENLRELRRIQDKITSQYTSFETKRQKQTGYEITRKQNQNQRKQTQLANWESRLKALEASLKQDKVRFYQEQDRERARADQIISKANKREIQLQTVHRKKQKDLMDEYDRKRQQLSREQDKIREQNLDIQRSKGRLSEQQRQVKRRLEEFEEKQKKALAQLHQQKTDLIEKQIQVSAKLNDLTLKQGQIQMQKIDLSNKAKILDLEKKKVSLQSKGKFDKTMGNILGKRQNNFMQTSKPLQTTGNYESYSKSISQMRDQMLKSLPKF